MLNIPIQVTYFIYFYLNEFLQFVSVKGFVRFIGVLDFMNIKFFILFLIILLMSIDSVVMFPFIADIADFVCSFLP